MTETIVGKLLNLTYDINTKALRILIEIMDEGFKEQLLRNHELKNKIKFVGSDVIWTSPLEK